MRKYLYLLIILSSITAGQAQSLRTLTIYADLIVTGHTVWEKSKPENDYPYIYDKFVVDEIIKGEFENKELLYTSFLEILREIEIDEDGNYTTEVLFLRKEDKHYYLIGNNSEKCITPVKEMLEIIKISDHEKRFSLTLDWYIQILESEIFHKEYVSYLEISKSSTFNKYYKEKGFFTETDSVFSPDQKKRILNKLLEIKLWDSNECEFAELIYKDFSPQIEQHILKMIKDYFKNDKYPHIYDIEKFLHILTDNKYSEAIKTLKNKITEKRKNNDIIIYAINELEKILDSQ